MNIFDRFKIDYPEFILKHVINFLAKASSNLVFFLLIYAILVTVGHYIGLLKDIRFQLSVAFISILYFSLIYLIFSPRFKAFFNFKEKTLYKLLYIVYFFILFYPTTLYIVCYFLPGMVIANYIISIVILHYVVMVFNTFLFNNALCIISGIVSALQYLSASFFKYESFFSVGASNIVIKELTSASTYQMVVLFTLISTGYLLGALLNRMELFITSSSEAVYNKLSANLLKQTEYLDLVPLKGKIEKIKIWKIKEMGA